MTRILLATDSNEIDAQIRAVLKSDVEILTVTKGEAVLPTAKASQFDLVIADFQIGNMGGMAVAMELRLEESAGKFAAPPSLLLLDRRPDVFLAKRSETQGWLIKPLEPMRTRRAIKALLAGDTYFDESYQPTPLVVGSTSA